MSELHGSKKIEAQNNQKKLRVFLVFLFLSILFWSLIKLSKEYIADVEFDLRFSDIPQNKLIQNTPEDKVILTIKTVGFKLLNYEFKKKVLEYSLTEIQNKEGSMFFSETSSNINFLQGQLPAESVVLNIEPDTLFFDLGVKRSKVVPVVTDVDFGFKSGYNFVGSYQISPQEVTISGPEKVIDSITEVHTVDFQMSDISETFEQEVGLKSLGNSIVLSEEAITISGNVDKITHGSYQIPFEVINLPRNVIISTYPKQVKVMFQVPLSDYSKIPENGFRIQCDFSKTQDNNLDYLIPVLVDKPEIITDVKIIPNKIEFLIKK